MRTAILSLILSAFAWAQAPLPSPSQGGLASGIGPTPVTSPSAAGQVPISQGASPTTAPFTTVSGDSSLAASGAMLNKQLHETVTALVFASSPYTVLATDSVLTCDASGGAVVINLPAATGSFREIALKKLDSSANACTLTRAGSDLIDGATTAAFTVQYAAARVQDTASGVWSRLHVNQLGGALGGVSTNATVNLAAGAAVTGVLPSANGGAGTVNGALKGNGSGTTSQAACADLSNAGTGCSASAYSGPTTQNVVTGSRVLGTVYQNATGKTMWVTVAIQSTSAGGANIAAYTDSNVTPVTRVAAGFANNPVDIPMSFLVLSGNYYECTASGGAPSLAQWTEWY